MPELISRADANQAVVELLGERIAAVFADCDETERYCRAQHYAECLCGMLLVTNRKLPAVAYVDDRAVRFESWNQTLATLIGEDHHG